MSISTAIVSLLALALPTSALLALAQLTMATDTYYGAPCISKLCDGGRHLVRARVGARARARARARVRVRVRVRVRARVRVGVRVGVR